jgi:SAM-dependent methyltransferase
MLKPRCPACRSTFALPTVKPVYWHCFNCKSVFVPGGLPQGGMVGGTGEEGRIAQNQMRIERLNQIVPGGCVLDFGCGHGHFVLDMRAAGFQSYGYDAFHAAFDTIPDSPQFDAVTMIEVVEHLHEPNTELAMIRDCLKPSGFLMIESTFRHDETLPEVLAWEYTNPAIGHCSIFSTKGLDGLLRSMGFELFNEVNRNVRVYRKL